MAARKTATPAPEPEVVYDFDNWDEEKETAAIAAIAPDVKYIIVERRFIGRFTDGDIVEVPLTLSLQQVEELDEEHELPVDKFRALLVTFTGAEAAGKFVQHDLAETVVMAQKYFTALQKVQMAAFPESSASSK